MGTGNPFRSRVTVVWAGLVLATCASWLLGSHDSGATSSTRRIVGVVILGVALVKVRFVGRWFMELREAPLVLRRLFDLYCVLLFVLLATTFAVG